VTVDLSKVTPRASGARVSVTVLGLAIACAVLFANERRCAAADPTSSEGAPDIRLIRQILQLPEHEAVNPKLFEVSSSPWQKRYRVVLVRGLANDQPCLAGLGLYPGSDAPDVAHVIATSGRLQVAEDETADRLDLAPFRITPTKTAIGLRVKRNRTYAAGGEGEASILRLYLQRGDKLVSVFSSLLEYRCEFATDLDEESGTLNRSGADGKSLVSISKRKTQGYFDLVQSSGKATVGVFEWNGQSYEPGSLEGRGRVWEDWGKECEVTDPR